MNTHEFPGLLAVRRIGSSLEYVDLSSTDPQCLYRLLGAYKLLSTAKTLQRVSSSATTILYAENFDPFAADTRHLADRLSALEHLLKGSEATIIVRTSSPLILLATPLLKNPRVQVLYLLSEGHYRTPILKESISAVKTLLNVGCQVSLVTGTSIQEKLNQPGTFRDTIQTLRASDLPFAFDQSGKISKTKAKFYLKLWLENCICEEDTRDAA